MWRVAHVAYDVGAVLHIYFQRMALSHAHKCGETFPVHLA